MSQDINWNIEQAISCCETLEQDNLRIRQELNIGENSIVICCGKEKDFYDGEVKWLILSIVKKENDRAIGTRNKDILKSMPDKG